MTCVEPAPSGRRRRLPVQDYDLALTLSSGQAFRWRPIAAGWEGVVQHHWLRLTQARGAIAVQTAVPLANAAWLRTYLQTEAPLDQVLASFPNDGPLRAACAAVHGLRLLRQDPWETLASFILSSSKQICQIQQIVEALCLRFGAPVAVPVGHPPAHAFPTPDRLAQASEADLRACKMGFRAPFLRETARIVARGGLDLESLRRRDVETARAELMELPGVGRKVADCVLLFAYGFQQAFPVDVWVTKALRRLYFPGRHVSARCLERFTQSYFGPYAGYAQQYLFHYMRVVTRSSSPVPSPP